MPTIKLNNANFYYELHGKENNQPLILIGGYTCDHTCWLPILGNLAQHFQVLIFDNRASGRTTDDNLPLTAELMAHDVMALAEALNLKMPHVIGHSMGGTIAQAVGSMYPNKISKLGILSSSAKWRHAMMTSVKLGLVMREKNLDLDLIIANALAWLFGEAFLKNEKNITEFKKAILENPYAQSLENQIRQFKVLADFDGDANLSKITVPTFIGHGNEDILSLPYESQYLTKQIANATCVEFDSGHGVMFEVPKKLSEALVDFFG